MCQHSLITLNFCRRIASVYIKYKGRLCHQSQVSDTTSFSLLLFVFVSGGGGEFG